ncbi:MAG: hypothetical protein ABI175_29615 [Polyangiales bacterium]
MSMRTLFVPAALLLLCACDDKGKGPPGLTPATATSTASATGTGSAAASPSSSSSAANGSASAAGACATLAKEKVERCNKLSGGDPTILTGCREAIDTMVKAADDAKCLKAMTPQTDAPSSDPDDL